MSTPMNRQFRRMAQRQGEVDEEGAPVASRRQPPPPKRERTSPGQFIKEVRGELRRVHWPTRAEVINYSVVVLVVIILLTLFVAGLDYGLAEGVLRLFGI